MRFVTRKPLQNQLPTEYILFDCEFASNNHHAIQVAMIHFKNGYMVPGGQFNEYIYYGHFSLNDTLKVLKLSNLPYSKLGDCHPKIVANKLDSYLTKHQDIPLMAYSPGIDNPALSMLMSKADDKKDVIIDVIDVALLLKQPNGQPKPLQKLVGDLNANIGKAHNAWYDVLSTHYAYQQLLEYKQLKSVFGNFELDNELTRYIELKKVFD